MKKVLGFLSILIILFITLAIITNIKDEEKIEGPDSSTKQEQNLNGANPKRDSAEAEKTDGQHTGEGLLNNPYKKEALHPKTEELLNDPNYQNIILPEELDRLLSNGEDAVVYFFSSTCFHCLRTTPILSEAAHEARVEVFKFNLLEFEEGWDKYHIDRTPILVQYKDGKEVSRLIGYQEKETFKEWFLNKKQ